MTAPIRRSIGFWQGIISPHMAGLAVALARRGCEITYVAQQALTEDRRRQGWSVPELPGVSLKIAGTAEETRSLAQAMPRDSAQVCGGLRSNGHISVAQDVFARRQVPQWVIMETVDDAGWRGYLRRTEYARLFRRWRGELQGVLAIGERTPAWVGARGMPGERVFPFAYFLPSVDTTLHAEPHGTAPFRFVFVGQLVERKRLDLLIRSLGALRFADLRLVVVGSGPLEDRLRAMAERELPGRVEWLGTLPMLSAAAEIARADCLVLPSRFDGWGAVVSESLMTGVPAICSDACGASVAVRASGHGGVFATRNQEELTALLRHAVQRGRPSDANRQALSHWATCLTTEAGADYLLKILDYSEQCRARPVPPWTKAS